MEELPEPEGTLVFSEPGRMVFRREDAVLSYIGCEPGTVSGIVHTSASKCMQMRSEENNGTQPQTNVPVIQSESVSLSESKSESSVCDDGDRAREADEREIASIGLKQGTEPRICVQKMKRQKTLWFCRYR